MPEARIGMVVIGRNEGERLVRCLASARGVPVVYVDSGSRDGSVAAAGAAGATVVELDARQPFTAARARNEGFRRLRALEPRLDYVQFVDGDCELAAGWIDAAVAFLDARPEVAAVCGRRRERFPERSVYNLLCDMEWDTPLGEAAATGGDALVRAAAFQRCGGYRASLIAGEEPELCARLRAAGWKIWRLDAEMSVHDAAMTRFAQWWRRTQRAGHAFAEVASLCRSLPGRPWRREAASAWFWGLALPLGGLALALAACAGVPLAGPAAGLVLLAYPLQIARVALRGRRSARENWLRAAAIVLGKFPEVLGEARFLLGRLYRAPAALMEYK